MEDGGHCASLSMSTSSPAEKESNCIADENESNNSSTQSTSTSNMANYPDNDLSEADIDNNKQVQPEVSTHCQHVTASVNGDFDLSMSPLDRPVTTVKVNGQTVLSEKTDKDEEDFDNTSDNDALIIDEERLSVIEDRNKQRIAGRVEKSPKSLDKIIENNDQISKQTEEGGIIPEHSNPYFSESIFELLNKKASASIPKKKSTVNKGNKSSQDRQFNKHSSKEYTQYLGIRSSAEPFLKCARCNLAGFPTVTMLNDHLAKCASISNFSGGNTGNVAVDNLNNNNRLNKKMFLCSTCVTYHTQADLFLHILHIHRRYVCLYCHGMFPGAERLARHLSNRHGASRYQRPSNHQEQQENNAAKEQSYNDINVQKSAVDNGEVLNLERQSPLRESEDALAGSKNNSVKALDRRYSNMLEFRNGYKEECYLVCCGCERVFGGATEGRDSGIVGDYDREVEGHVCKQGNTTTSLPSQLCQPSTPREFTEPSVETNNASPIMTNPIESPQQQPNTNIVVETNDNVQSLKSNTDSHNIINTQTPSPRSIPGDSIQDDCRDQNQSNNEDMMDCNTKVDRTIEGADEDPAKQAFRSDTSPPHVSTSPSSLHATQPDTRKVPKVTLKLTKPYEPHNMSDYSDSDSYLSDENNDNESSDSDKLTMEVDASVKVAEENNTADLDERDQLIENTEENTEDELTSKKTMELEGGRDEQKEGVENDVGQEENKVAQMDGGVDEESTADGGIGKLDPGLLLDHSLPQELTVAGNDVPVLELEEMLEQPLDKMEPQSLLRHMLLTSVAHCLYCNHARVIPVEGRQLALHALGEHRYSATVRSITAEELIPESFNTRLRDCMPELRGRYFNLQNQPRKIDEDGSAGESADVVVKVNNKVRFECFQCRYQTAVHKELYQHNRKLHSKALLLCIMCKTSFLHYSELICHLCPGIYDVAPLLEPPEAFQQSSNTSHSIGAGNTNIPADENNSQSANVLGTGTGAGAGAGAGSNGISSGGGTRGIAVPDIRFRCCLCTKDKSEPEEKKINTVWELPSAFRLMVHLRKRHHLCDVCMESCQSQQKLANHVWKHKLNHFCYRCGIAYRNKADITKHLYWKHGTESVDCRRCLLKRWPHVYHFCQPAAQFPCDECTLTFSRAMCLRVHKRLHLSTIEQQKPYVCTWREEEEQEQEQAHEENPEKTTAMNEIEDKVESVAEDAKGEISTVENDVIIKEKSDLSKEVIPSSVAVCGQRFISRKMLRKHEFRHREPKDDESEQVIVDEVDIAKEDINVIESMEIELEKQGTPLDQKQEMPVSKEEIEAEESKISKPKVDVYDLPALNLSESDSSDTEDETETKMGIDDEQAKIDPENGLIEIKRDVIGKNELNKASKIDGDLDVVKSTAVLDNIWDNFKNYQKSKLDRQSTNPSPSTSGFPMDDEEEMPILTDIAPPLTEELVLRDHDYCYVTADTLNEQDPTLNDDNTQISSVDHDYCTGVKETDEKKEESEENNKTTVPASLQIIQLDKTTNSGSDSDSSSCTCGSNCSCSSSSSSDGEDSSTSNDSSSDSSSSEGRRRQQAKREKKRQKKLANKGRKTSTNITTVENSFTVQNTSHTVIDVVDVVKREPVIHESDLETTESETDEDFYEEQPQRFALKLLAEKREKLLQKVDEDLQLNGSLLGSRPVTPTSLTATQNVYKHSSTQIPATSHSSKKSRKSKSKSKKKKKKASRRKRNRSKSHSKSSDINPSHLYAQQFQQHLLYQQQLQQQQLARQYGRQVPAQQLAMGVTAPITLSLKQSATSVGNSMYGATPNAAIGGMTPAQMAALGAANTMAGLGGGGTGSIHGQSGNSTPDDSNTRASKRRRVPNKFYGYSSDEEGSTGTLNLGPSITSAQTIKWRKIESPKRPRSPLVVPPITIKTIPPQVTIQSNQPTIPPLRIQHKSSNFSHTRPPRQFHPPNSKYRQKTQSNKRSRSSTHQHNTISAPKPPLLSIHHQNQPTIQSQTLNTSISNNDSSNDSSSDDEQQQHAQAQPVVQAAAPPPVQQLQPPLQHRKGFSLQQQQQQQQRMLNSAVSIGAGVRRGPTGAIVGAAVAGSGATPVPAAPGIALYCYCRCPYDEVSEMIGCDSDECAIEWFHFECVGIMVPPKGQWFCPDCRKRKQQRREMQLQLQQQKQHVQH